MANNRLLIASMVLLGFVMNIRGAYSQLLFLPQPDAPTALSRSLSQCAALGCDGVRTKYWWSVQPLTDNSVAIVIQIGTPFDKTTTTSTVKTATGLNAPEQAALVSASSLGTKLPWIITQAQFQARLTGPQLTALNASVNPAVATPWATLRGGSTIDLKDPMTTGLADVMTTTAILTLAQAVSLLAPTPVTAVVTQ